MSVVMMMEAWPSFMDVTPQYKHAWEASDDKYYGPHQQVVSWFPEVKNVAYRSKQLKQITDNIARISYWSLK